MFTRNKTQYTSQSATDNIKTMWLIGVTIAQFNYLIYPIHLNCYFSCACCFSHNNRKVETYFLNPNLIYNFTRKMCEFG